MKKKCLAFVLTAILTLPAAVCGGSGNGLVVKAASPSQEEATALADEINPIEEAMKKMQSVNSMEAQVVMDMDIALAYNGMEEKLERLRQ